MSAERLRLAAERLREVAGAATSGPWVAKPPHGWATSYDNEMLIYAPNSDSPDYPITPGGGEHGDDGLQGADATYVATMHPPVALVLAETLDWIANISVDIKGTGERTPMVDLPGMDRSAATRLADAILGSES